MAAVALPVTTAILATLLGAAPAPEFERDHSALPKADFGKAENFTPKHERLADPTEDAAAQTHAHAARKVAWPTASSAIVAVPALPDSKVKVPQQPVTLSQALPPASPKSRSVRTDASTSPAKAEVHVLDRANTTKLGIDGVVLSVSRADGEAEPSALSVALDYSSFAHAYSGNWSSRLRMVQLPACALTTPDKAACRTTTPVPSSNNTSRKTVTAQVSTPKTAPTMRRATGAARTVLALSAGAASDQGGYEATPLSPSATWAGGGSNGDFTWSYPMDAVPAPAGPAPSLSLGYSAQSVDGRTSSTSAQASWIGEGFDLPTSYIERSYGSCDDDGQDKKYDQCWKEDNASIVLNGKSSSLVPVDKAKGTWRLQGDDGERVVRGTGAANGDDDGEYWTVTTTDGTQYVFGRNRLSGWTSGKPETNSVWTVPVFGDDPDEPGYSAGNSFADRSKNQAWRWNLDYVVDPRGNVMTYWYEKELNYYAKNGTTGNGTEYTRGGYLSRIDYGQRSDTVFSTTQPSAARVKFSVAERCIPIQGKETCASLTEANRNAWPDVPFDLICKKDTVCTDQPSPSFFSRKRLTGITTQVYKGTGTGADSDYRDVNHWSLDHSFPDPCDGSNATLWLKSIQHTGKSGTPSVSLPPVTFTGVQLHNRVDKIGDDVAPFIKWRIRTVTSETGSVLTVNYSAPECIADTNIPTALDKNTKLCYPVKWIPPSNPTPGTDPKPRTDWFHKYVVTQVTESDPTGNAPLKQTDYTYNGGGAWAYDDQSPITPAKYRTWGIWRGYQKVTTTTGEASGTRSKSVSLFYRGMNGDKQTDGSTRKETLTDSQGTIVTDEEPYAGQTREQIAYNGTSGAEVSGTITTPWSQTTATATHSYGTVRAYMTRTAKEVLRTPVSGSADITSTTSTTYDTDSGQPLTIETEGGGEKDCTRTEYAKNTAAWMLTYVKRAEKVSVGCTATPNRTGDPKTTDVVSDIRTSYDGQAWGTPPTKGNTTATQRVIGYANGTAQLQTISTAQYDALGRVTDEWDTHNTRTTHTEYTPAAGGPLTSTKAANALGHTVTTEIIPDWGVNKVSTDPNGRRTEMAYDALGRLTDVWLADRNRANQTASKKFEYKIDRGQAWVATKSLNNDGTTYQTSYAIYDALLRPRQTQTPAATGTGRVISETKYDSRGLEVETAAGYIDTTAPSGRLAVLLTAAPAGSRKTYDGAGRPTADIVLALGREHSRTTTTYEGNSTTVEPPNGAAAVRESVDSRGRLAEKREYAGPKATGDYTKLTYTYGRADQLASVQDSDGNTWKFEYDFLGRTTTRSDPDTGTTKTEYNSLDQASVTENSNGDVISHTYDLLGRPTGKLTGRIPLVDGKPAIDDTKYVARWTYDTVALGRPTSAIRYDGGKNGKAYAYTNAAYDPLYRVLKEQYTISTAEGAVAGNGTYTLTNSFNLDGTPQKRTIPAMGGLAQETLVYGYNDQRLPTTLQGLTGIVQGTDYLPAGERTRITLGVSSSAKWTEINTFHEDGTKRLSRQTVVSESHPGTDADTNYRYDPAGNPVEIEDRSTSTGDKQCFNYDGHRRLKTAWTSKGDCTSAPTSSGIGGVAPYWQSFTYDSAGNRKSATDHLAAGGPATTNYTYDQTAAGKARPHLLSSTTPGNPDQPKTSYTYDAAGNTKTRTIGTKTQTLDWGPEGDLAKATEADGSETSFLNDASGNRLIRRDKTGTTLYLGETELRFTKATGKVEATRYYSHAGQPVAMRTPQALTWMCTDHNGTGNVQIDATTQAVTRRYTQPFGEERGTKPTGWAGERGFAGGTQDPTGLTHLGARSYDTATGRFISADPIADLKDPQQINGYAYSNNNPVTYADPDGKFFGLGLFDFIFVAVAVVSFVNAVLHTSYRQQSSSRASRTSSRSGMSAMGSGNYGNSGGGEGGGGSNCSSTYPAYKPGCNTNVEPANPKAQGSFGDFIAGIGHNFFSALETIGSLGPACWFQDCSGTTDKYDKFVTEHGADKDTKAWDAGDSAAEVAGLFNIAGMFKSLAKKLLKGGAKSAPKESPKIPKGCKCFLAGTQVELADGTTKSIEDLEIGEEVLATDPETGETGARKVVRLIVTEDDKKFNELTIETADGPEKLTATHEHPFWVVSEKRWIEAGLLRPGMTLRTDEGSTVAVRGNRSFEKRARTYNFTVDDLHTYYVMAGETPVLVHNSNCGNRKHDKARGAAGVDEMTETFEKFYDKSDIYSESYGNGLDLWTPYGRRQVDIAVRTPDGNLHLYEVKVNKSNYTKSQRRKDEWLAQTYGFETSVIRRGTKCPICNP
ncbi:polymorphic toxin-type HINT domain-containing protein [Streptomyces sp. NPDC003077]|uniref:polymorphic toxin-type HINT domain-containing protein n=1 Tax=Streptomyces sp. NPDC003077 TaxID=3154443 RepID=UPI0033BDD6FA